MYFGQTTYRTGFPLDDAWIHQTYARNLAWYGEWAFLRHIPSSGSTAPLWSLALVPGYLLRIDPFHWAAFLGWGLLWGMGELGVLLAKKLTRHKSRALVLGAGILLILEWHLIWAAMSGMETLLAALLNLLIVTWVIFGTRNWFWLGALIGLSVWVRPDGITLLMMVGILALLEAGDWRAKFSKVLWLACGFALLFLPYLLFNRTLAGAWWPSTFYAKQAEYAIERLEPLSRRTGEQALQPLIGVGLLLIPGFFITGAVAIRKREWRLVGALVWAIAYLVLYAVRLPVVYQHGRYSMPVMPVIWLLSFAGMLRLIDLNSPGLARRVLSRTWALASGLVILGFVLLGGRAYGRDVAFIESEMVDTAKWIAGNLPRRALLAAHDIGALGYWGEHQIIDLAGLVSPEVIPIIRDETALAKFLTAQSVDYLMTFPGWYPELTANRDLIYESGAPFSPDQGGENMAVFCWDCENLE